MAKRAQSKDAISEVKRTPDPAHTQPRSSAPLLTNSFALDNLSFSSVIDELFVSSSLSSGGENWPRLNLCISLSRRKSSSASLIASSRLLTYLKKSVRLG